MKRCSNKLLSRDEFCNIFTEEYSTKLVSLLLESEDMVVKFDGATVWYDYNTESVIIGDYNKFISWYKLFHVGRSLEFSGFKTKTEVIDFINNLIKQL